MMVDVRDVRDAQPVWDSRDVRELRDRDRDRDHRDRDRDRDGRDNLKRPLRNDMYMGEDVYSQAPPQHPPGPQGYPPYADGGYADPTFDFDYAPAHRHPPQHYPQLQHPQHPQEYAGMDYDSFGRIPYPNPIPHPAEDPYSGPYHHHHHQQQQLQQVTPP